MREMVVDLKRALKGRPVSSAEGTPSPAPPRTASTRRIGIYAAIATVVVAAAVTAALVPWTRADPARRLETLLVGAPPTRLTDFENSEFAAAISPDGRLVAFVSDRDGPFDVWLTHVGSGEFSNLTKGEVDNLFDPDIAAVGFTPDGTNIWIRITGNAGQVSVMLKPVLGGALRPLIVGMHPTWSQDGGKLAYHQSISGDPIFVADPDGANGRRVVDPSPGIHNHFLLWTADGKGVYAARGYMPYQMDLWRLAVDSAATAPARLTHHNARVSFPALLDANTLLYIATAADSADQTLFALDLPSGISRRIMFGVDQYTSVSVGGPPGNRRLALTADNPTSEIWTIPITAGITNDEAATPIKVSTAKAHGPRYANGAIVYRSSRGGPESLWKTDQGRATELWKAPQGGLTAAPAVSLDGRSIAVVVRNQDRATLRVMDADGTNVRTLAPGLDVRDSPSWSPDGRWLAVGADEGNGARVFKVPIDGGPPVRLVNELSRAPQWSPDGSYLVYGTPLRAAFFTLRAVTPDGQPRAMPDAIVGRYQERYHFTPDGRSLVIVGPSNRDLWLMDMATGKQRQLTAFRGGASIESFDVSPDGKTIVFDRVRQNADIYTIDLKSQRR
jgi:Tol biopolymer transport system component